MNHGDQIRTALTFLYAMLSLYLAVSALAFAIEPPRSLGWALAGWFCAVCWGSEAVQMWRKRSRRYT